MHTRVYLEGATLGIPGVPHWTGDCPPLREGDLLSTPSRSAVRVTYVKTHLLGNEGETKGDSAQEVRVR
jgi:hypothetical protein